MRRRATAMLAIVWATCGAAGAAPINYVHHNADGYGNTGPIESVGPQSGSIDYDFPYQQTYFTGANFGEVYANVTPGAVGIFARAHNIGVYAPQRQEVSASSKFDVVFTSPTSDPIDVVLNLELSGEIDPALYLYSTVQVSAGITSVGAASGSYSEILDPLSPSPTRDGMLSSFTANGTKQTISTGVLSNVPVNVPVQVFLEMFTIAAYTTETPTISFGNTLNLTTGGDVFSLSGPNASEIEVNSVDASIVNNQFYGVPEPHTLALSAVLIVCGMATVRRRTRR